MYRGDRANSDSSSDIRNQEQKVLANPIRTILEKCTAVVLFFAAVFFVAIIFIGLEYENDHKDRIKFGSELLHVVMEIEDTCSLLVHNNIDIIQFRTRAKEKFLEMHAMQDRLGIGIDYRKDSWTVFGSFFYVLSTITTIGYGYPAPKTPEGKLTAMLLYVVGVPLTFLVVMDLVEIIFIVEKSIGLKIHNNTVQFRENLRLVRLKCCFWCKEPEEEIPLPACRRNTATPLWRRRMRRKKRTQARKGRRHYNRKTEKRRAKMKVRGYIVDDTESDPLEVPSPRADAVCDQTGPSEQQNCSQVQCNEHGLEPECRRTASEGEGVQMTNSAGSNMTRKQAWPESEDSAMIQKNDSASDTELDSDILQVTHATTDSIPKSKKGQGKATAKEALKDNLKLDDNTYLDTLKKGRLSSLVKNRVKVERKFSEPLPYIRRKTAKLTYVDERTPKRPLSCKSSKTSATSTGFGTSLAERASDNGSIYGSTENFQKAAKKFGSDSQLYDYKYHGTAYDSEFTYNLPGNFNECNNKKQSTSGRCSVDCVIQIEDYDEDDCWYEQEGTQNQRAKSLSESHLQAKSGQITLPGKKAYSTGRLGSEINDIITDLPQVHKAIQPLIGSLAARFDFHSPSQEFEQTQKHASGSLQVSDMEEGKEERTDEYQHETSLTEDLTLSRPHYDAVTNSQSDDRTEKKVVKTTIQSKQDSEPKTNKGSRVDAQQIPQCSSVNPSQCGSDTSLQKQKQKLRNITCDVAHKAVCWKRFTKKRTEARKSSAEGERKLFMKYPKDPMPIPLDLEAFKEGREELRKRRERLIPPCITLTTPDNETRVILSNSKNKLPKSVSRRRRKKRARGGRQRSETPEMPFLGDEPSDSRVTSSSHLTMANLIIYVLFGAIMYVKGQEWSYLDATYFLFTSISTVGYGDLLPEGNVFLFFSSLYVLFGLALLAKVVSGFRNTMYSTMVKMEKAIIKKLEQVGQVAILRIARSARWMSMRVSLWRKGPVTTPEGSVIRDTLAVPVERVDSLSVLSTNPNNSSIREGDAVVLSLERDNSSTALSTNGNNLTIREGDTVALSLERDDSSMTLSTNGNNLMIREGDNSWVLPLEKADSSTALSTNMNNSTLMEGDALGIPVERADSSLALSTNQQQP